MSRTKLAESISKTHCIHRKIRELLINLVAPDFFSDHDYVADFFGMKFFGNTSSYLDREVLMRGAYEKFLLYFMRDALAHIDNSNAVFLDIGANVGHHSLFMSQYAKTVHAFEPYALVRDKFHQLIELNAANNIIVHEEGLSNKTAKLAFIEPEKSSLGKGRFAAGEEPDIDGGRKALHVVRGDELIKANSIGDIEIIKIDVEGHERYVLEGLQQTLNMNMPLVVFEYLDSTQEKMPEISEILKFFPAGYKLYYFSKRNKKNGAYEVRMLPTALTEKIRDIIAFPPQKYTGFSGL